MTKSADVKIVKQTPTLIETPLDQWLKAPVGHADLMASLEKIAKQLTSKDIRKILAMMPDSHATFSYEKH